MIDLSSQQIGNTTQKTRTQQPLYEPAQLQQKSVSALRAAFNHWIRSLPMEQRFLALKIHSSSLPNTIRRVFAKMEESTHDRCIQMQVAKCETSKEDGATELKKHSRKIEKSFYDSLVFVTDGHDFLDHICFEFGLLECPEKLFDFLMTPADAACTKPMFQALKNKVSAEKVNERIKKGKTKLQSMIEIVNYLRQQVLLRFRQSMLDCQFITKNLEQEKRRKKEFNTYWKYLSQETRRNLLLLNHATLTELHKWLTVNDIFLPQQQLSSEVEELLKLQKNEFCNRIFKCKFKKSLSSIICYYEQVYNLWKKDLDKTKRKRIHKYSLNQKDIKTYGKIEIKQKQPAKKNKNKVNRKSNSLESNETNVTDNEKVHQKFEKQEVKLILEKKQESHESKEFIKQEISIQKDHSIKKPRPEKPKHKKQSKNKLKIESKDFQEKQEIKMKQKDIYERQQQSPINPQTKRIQVAHKGRKVCRATQQIKEVHLLKLSQQLQDMSDKTSEQANEFHDRRVVAFQRIQYLLAFYNISIRLFGSCASGIAIKNSDIDIAVDNSILTHYDYLPENLKLLGALESLQQVFASQPCFTYIKVISTASIPVIKLTIDTSVVFLNPSYGEVFQNLNRPHFSGPVEADITIETVNKLSQCNHLGLISTEAINQWLSQIPSLHTIVIFMKQIFKNYRFNITYEGGINTFAMIVLMVAYIRHAKMEAENNVAFVLQSLLRFYSDQFNQKQLGIDVLKHKNTDIFYKKVPANKNSSKDASDLEILDPKCQGKNMTRNCYQFPQIKKMFREILIKCYDEPYEDATKLYKINSNKEELYEKIRESNENRNVFIEFLTN